MLEPADRERWLAAAGRGVVDGSIADELAGVPPQAGRGPVAHPGLIGAPARPPGPGTAFVAFYHELGEAAGAPGDWGYAAGGMGAVTQALRAAAEAAGARVRTEAPVHRIARRDGRATGVALEGGEELEARVVVSAA